MTAPGNLPDDLSEEEVVFVDSQPDNPEAAVQTASSLATKGRRKVAALLEPCDAMPSRRRDTESGVCCIPRIFTVFDLQWVEKQWQN